MSIAENNVVSISYELKDALSGEILDSNIGSRTLPFIVGKNQIIPGLENEIVKMSLGDNKQIKVLAQDAYGEYSNDALQVLPIEQFAGLELHEGMNLYGQGEDGNTVQVIVKSFTKDDVTIDFNHPLAGKDLVFDITVEDIREATEEELSSGMIAGHGCGCGSGGCGEHSSDDHECCGGHGHSHDDHECCGGGNHGGGHGGCCGGH